MFFGQVGTFLISAVPEHWIILDGREFDPEDYPLLYNLFPACVVPNWSGRFLRMCEELDKSDILNSQSNEFKAHTHVQYSHYHSHPHTHAVGYGGFQAGTGAWKNQIMSYPGDNNTNTSQASTNNTNSTIALNQNTGGTETRPDCIKVVYAVCGKDLIDLEKINDIWNFVEKLKVDVFVDESDYSKAFPIQTAGPTLYVPEEVKNICSMLGYYLQ